MKDESQAKKILDAINEHEPKMNRAQRYFFMIALGKYHIDRIAFERIPIEKLQTLLQKLRSAEMKTDTLK